MIQISNVVDSASLGGEEGVFREDGATSGVEEVPLRAPTHQMTSLSEESKF